ncbi:protoheme IX farnesyltransferase [Candidatus Sumerlaeota bacterium]|nr:protoheme IX farnesyltransferase [Candidatus Sumerlaeota bacterium]
MLRSYLSLTKPSICLLVLITGAAALVWEGSFTREPLHFLMVMVGLFSTAGCANALNQYLERDRDALMKRTAKRRPLPTGQITPRSALVFAVTTGVLGVGIFAAWFNAFSALLALATILFYAFFYTLYLKPRTAQNIVIGGAAGAMGPVIAWAAATDLQGMTWVPWVMFGIIFLWTPPHFWALALCLQEDYKANPLPMMPNVAGEKSTLRQMVVYTVALIAISLSLVWAQAGMIYMVTALVTGGLFLWKAVLSLQQRETRQYWGLFGYSIVYLFVLFGAMMVDVMLRFPGVRG